MRPRKPRDKAKVKVAMQTHPAVFWQPAELDRLADLKAKVMRKLREP